MTTRKKVKINVTEEDIAEGRPFDCKAVQLHSLSEESLRTT
jgi:hypothetical protein